MRIKSANNIAIEQGILAVAKAHARTPGFSIAKAKETATQIDRAVTGVRTAEVVVALCINLLRGIGFVDALDDSAVIGSRELTGRN